MYYIGKIIQASGLTFILVAFMRKFPNLMSYKEFLIGMIVFLMGWIIDRYLTKKNA